MAEPEIEVAEPTRGASRSRRAARSCAFQALYMLEIGESDGPTALETVLEHQPLLEPALGFLKQEFQGVWIHLKEIDQIIERFLTAGWTLSRIAVTDRIALRMAIFELYHLPGMPPKVTITESVELAKRFGAAGSGRFVNGLLANVLNISPKAHWDPAQAEAHEEQDLLPDGEDLADDEPMDEVVEVVEGSPEHGDILKAGPWVIRNEPQS